MANILENDQSNPTKKKQRIDENKDYTVPSHQQIIFVTNGSREIKFYGAYLTETQSKVFATINNGNVNTNNGDNIIRVCLTDYDFAVVDLFVGFISGTLGPLETYILPHNLSNYDSLDMCFQFAVKFECGDFFKFCSKYIEKLDSLSHLKIADKYFSDNETKLTNNHTIYNNAISCFIKNLFHYYGGDMKTFQNIVYNCKPKTVSLIMLKMYEEGKQFKSAYDKAERDNIYIPEDLD